MARQQTFPQKVSECELMPFDSAQTRLSYLWLSGSANIVLLVAMQSLMGHFEDKSQAAWEWLLPSIMPTLGLIVAILG